MNTSTVISDATFKRTKTTILRRYRAVFAGLAAYDRGEYEIA